MWTGPFLIPVALLPIHILIAIVFFVQGDEGQDEDEDWMAMGMGS